jgi:hypothetical protein
MRACPFLTVAAALPLLTAQASAQAVTVQQPVVGVFNVNTAVSVPDRGSALVGSVARAASGRKSYGFPPRYGSSYGVSRSNSSVQTSVWIHDLSAMDEAVLGAASETHAKPLDPRFAALRGSSATETRITSTRQAAQSTRRTSRPKPDMSAERFLRLGRAAEKRGKPRVAQMHYRQAAKRGSIIADQRLTALASAE